MPYKRNSERRHSARPTGPKRGGVSQDQKGALGCERDVRAPLEDLTSQRILGRRVRRIPRKARQTHETRDDHNFAPACVLLDHHSCRCLSCDPTRQRVAFDCLSRACSHLRSPRRHPVYAVEPLLQISLARSNKEPRLGKASAEVDVVGRLAFELWVSDRIREGLTRRF